MSLTAKTNGGIDNHNMHQLLQLEDRASRDARFEFKMSTWTTRPYRTDTDTEIRHFENVPIRGYVLIFL